MRWDEDETGWHIKIWRWRREDIEYWYILYKIKISKHGEVGRDDMRYNELRDGDKTFLRSLHCCCCAAVLCSLGLSLFFFVWPLSCLFSLVLSLSRSVYSLTLFYSPLPVLTSALLVLSLSPPSLHLTTPLQPINIHTSPPIQSVHHFFCRLHIVIIFLEFGREWWPLTARRTVRQRAPPTPALPLRCLPHPCFFCFVFLT